MQCKSLWIKASAKCINVNVNYTVRKKSVLAEDYILYIICFLLGLWTFPLTLIQSMVNASGKSVEGKK